MCPRDLAGAQHRRKQRRGAVNQIRRKNWADPQVLLLVRLTITLVDLHGGERRRWSYKIMDAQRSSVARALKLVKTLVRLLT